MSGVPATRDEMIDLARRAWGAENKAPSKRDEMRWGSNGSKSLDLKKLRWFDHEANAGGGYASLYKLVHGHYPNGGTNDIAATYDYRDEKSTLLFQVVRKLGHKFVQRRPNGSGGWTWELTGIRRVLYELPELIAAAPDSLVFIPEGEKDVENLRSHLLIATCNPGGAVEHKDKTKPYRGKWRDEYSEFLRDRHVVVLPDNDEPGHDHAQDVARRLHGIAASVRILELPNLPAKGDVSDWLANGGTADELDRLAREAPLYQPTDKEKEKRATAKPNLFMMEVALETSAIWAGAVRWNEFTEYVEIALDLPRLDPAPWAELNDKMVLEALAHWQRAKYSKLTKTVMNDALDLIAHRKPHHPVREYLRGPQWDNKQRIAGLFQHYFNAEMSPLPDPNKPAPNDQEKIQAYAAHAKYLAAISKCFMVAAVARVMKPGSKHDYTPILISDKQRRKKSMGIAALCPNEDWFTDNIPPDVAERDTKESLTGLWIVELSEMPSMRKDVERRKAFNSTRRDRYRVAYDRRTSTHPRQCVFIGSANDLEFVDPTGNSRWWPVRVGDAKIDVDKIIADRDQLWAEALHLYEAGEHWWLDEPLEAIAEDKQAAFNEARETPRERQLARTRQLGKRPAGGRLVPCPHCSQHFLRFPVFLLRRAHHHLGGG
jgi:predicted P-loop ATPase